MSTYSKYLDKFLKRHESILNTDKENKNHITDPFSYIGFLELQVEKSAKSVLLTDALSQKIDSLQNQINNMDTKISRNSDLINLIENCREQQEEEFKQTNENCKKLTDFVENNKNEFFLKPLKSTIDNLHEEILDQTNQLNNYNKLLSEEFSKKADFIINKVENHLLNEFERKINVEIQKINYFKSDIEEFIANFTKNSNETISNLHNNIIHNCHNIFLRKEDFFSENSNSQKIFKSLFGNEINFQISQNNKEILYNVNEQFLKIKFENENLIQKQFNEIDKLKFELEKKLEKNYSEIENLKIIFNEQFFQINKNYQSGLKKTNEVLKEIKKQDKKKENIKEKRLKKEIEQIKLLSSHTVEKLEKIKESYENKLKNEEGKSSETKKLELRLSQSLKRNFSKINNLFNENSTQQKKIESKVNVLNKKTNTLQKALKTKVKKLTIETKEPSYFKETNIREKFLSPQTEKKNYDILTLNN